jgi:hypothetical protein
MCGGTTTISDVKWETYGLKGITAAVDTKQCKFSEVYKKGLTPNYFASIIGDESKWQLTGTNVLLDCTPTGFRVFAYHPSLRSQHFLNIAMKFFRISWIAAHGVNAGSTSSGKGQWKSLHDTALYIDVDASRPGFEVVPKYLTSLSIARGHARLLGAHSVFLAKEASFRVYLHREDGAKITTQDAKLNGWSVNWLGSAEGDLGNSVGSSKVNSWKDAGAAMLFSVREPAAMIAVDTSIQSYGTVPAYITSLQTSDDLRLDWDLGAAGIYSPTSTGFKVYVAGASQQYLDNWRINYLGFEQPLNCKVSSWGKWMKCTKTCAGGLQLRVKTVVVWPNMFGKPCGQTRQQRACNPQPCPVKCEVSQWSKWSVCSTTWCGTKGKQTKTRKMTQGPKSAAERKVSCPTLHDSKECGNKPCVEGTGEGPSLPCGGRVTATTGMAGDWKSIDGGQLFVDINTTSCDFHKVPTYTASLETPARDWKNAGTSTVSHATKTGFRVNMWHPSVASYQRGEFARQRGWQVSWLGDGGINAGITTFGNSGWEQATSTSLSLDVNTRGCGYTNTPKYITSLYNMDQLAQGVHDIYLVKADGFRVYITTDDAHITPDHAEAHNWAVAWIAVPLSSELTGQSSPGQWKQGPLGTIYTDVDTTANKFTKDPYYSTTIVMGTQALPIEGLYGGATVIKRSAKGFRIYLGPPNPSMGKLQAWMAQKGGWKVNYIGFEGTAEDSCVVYCAHTITADCIVLQTPTASSPLGVNGVFARRHAWEAYKFALARLPATTSVWARNAQRCTTRNIARSTHVVSVRFELGECIVL